MKLDRLKRYPNQILEAIGTDGEIYYKCMKCGAVGNWKAFIETGKCHKK